MINVFLDNLKIKDLTLYKKLFDILNHISNKNENLILEVKWNQLMFIMNKTYIIGFSYSKDAISIAIEKKFLDMLKKEIIASNYECTKMLFKIKKHQTINFKLIDHIISFIKKEKENCETFWITK